MLVFFLSITTSFPLQEMTKASSSGVDPAERSVDPADTFIAWSSLKINMHLYTPWNIHLPQQPWLWCFVTFFFVPWRQPKDSQYSVCCQSVRHHHHKWPGVLRGASCNQLAGHVCSLAAIRVGKSSPQDCFWSDHDYNNNIMYYIGSFFIQKIMYFFSCSK